jgi:hypothetical protein
MAKLLRHRQAVLLREAFGGGAIDDGLVRGRGVSARTGLDDATNTVEPGSVRALDRSV